MANCPLYNGQNLDFTGKENPYGLIQKAGKKRSRKSMRKRGKTMRKSRKSRKHRH
jgi:hypothetical protein